MWKWDSLPVLRKNILRNFGNIDLFQTVKKYHSRMDIKTENC
jgi:hypothetical protein